MVAELLYIFTYNLWSIPYSFFILSKPPSEFCIFHKQINKSSIIFLKQQMTLKAKSKRIEILPLKCYERGLYKKINTDIKII